MITGNDVAAFGDIRVIDAKSWLINNFINSTVRLNNRFSEQPSSLKGGEYNELFRKNNRQRYD
ncbi:hypothetical protein ACFPU1_12685 [Thalassorhabdus alkalitolerans]|uniref:Uncharacterized protein n=1 Tax=Thalassorhabdus alkalitolerans TaxID=2282697 RepID=A0ABW0YQA4_9BACI